MSFPVDEHQFCFIIAVSDDLYKEECLTYLGALEVPEGYTTDVLTVEGADSVSAAYQAAMEASAAKYKIYLRQELFLTDRRILARLLEGFADPAVGMIGLAGTAELSGDGVFANSEPLRPETGTAEAAALDGRFLATQTDLPWRQELFAGGSFPGPAQSLEFRKAGYRIAVMADGAGKAYHYDIPAEDPAVFEADRRAFLKEYPAYVHGGGKKKRILYPDMGLVSTWNIPYALAANELDVVFMQYTGTPEHRRARDIDTVSAAIRRLHADAVMTHDYYVPIALACAENDIPYIAWIYDSIQVALYDESVRGAGNYIFDFDRMQADETAERGAFYVKHQPLASNPYLADTLEITKEDERRFTCDVSFIGSLYKDEDFVIPYEKLSEETGEEIRELLAAHVGRWDGEVRFAGRLSDKAMAEMAEKLLTGMGYDRKLIGDRRYIEETFFSRGITHTERMEMLKRLGKLDADVRLYTRADQGDIRIPGVRTEGSLDYSKELPKAYYLSRININLTLPSIRSGVPLRVFDILSAGGFLLTNDQPELSELFTPGRDLEVFRDYDEMADKAKYYLKHDRERLQIALNGHRRVREKYSYDLQVKRILEEVSQDLIKRGKKGLV